MLTISANSLSFMQIAPSFAMSSAVDILLKFTKPCGLSKKVDLSPRRHAFRFISSRKHVTSVKSLNCEFFAT